MSINKYLFTIFILLHTSAFAVDSIENLVDYVPYDSNINLTVSFLEKENINNEVKGIQFDIFYDFNDLVYNESTCLLEGITFEYELIKEGQIRSILFNLNGQNITSVELLRLINISFTQKENFYNETIVYLDNIIIIGNYGEDISFNYASNTFKIDFNILKPSDTYIHNLDNNIFQDSIIIFFQLHEPSEVNISLYDEFEINRKTIIAKYMNFGLYNFTLDGYDQFQEELSYGRYKIKFLSNDVYRDSIHVVYQRSN